jgi:hypothetical protein
MGNAKNRRKTVPIPPLSFDEDIALEVSALVSSVTLFIIRTYAGSKRLNVTYEEIQDSIQQAFKEPICETDIDKAIKGAISANAIHTYSNSSCFSCFMEKVVKLVVPDTPSRTRYEKFWISLLVYVDGLAVADFAGIHAEFDDDGFEHLARFKEQNAHKWVIVATPFDMEFAYCNDLYPQEDQQVRIVEEIYGQ